MKKKQSITIKLAGFYFTSMIAALLISMSACNNTAKKTNDKQVETEKKAKVPSMDIHAATFMGNVNAASQHIAAGTDLNAKDQYGSTPLMIAATFGKTDIALALIKADAKLNITSNDGSTALHTAAFFGRKQIVQALLNKGADKNIQNKHGSTALQAVQSSFESVKPIYDQISKDLGPFGLKLDYKQLENIRPEIAKILQE